MAMTPHDPSGGGAFPFGSSVPSAALPHQDALPLLRPSAVRLVRGAPERPIGLSYQPNSPCRRLLGSHPSVVAIERTADWKALESFAEYGAWRADDVTRSLARLIEKAPGRLWYGYHVSAVDDTKVHRSGA